MSDATDAYVVYDDLNIVAFQYGAGDDEVAVADAPVRADNGISQAWQKIMGQNQIRPNQIVAVYGEWEPTAADYEFVGWNFPKVSEVKFSFTRPESGDWDAALRQAAATRAAAMREMHAQEATDNLVATLTDPEAPEPVAIPMLRMVTSPPPRPPTGLCSLISCTYWSPGLCPPRAEPWH